jgi:hypothetical protein
MGFARARPIADEGAQMPIGDVTTTMTEQPSSDVVESFDRPGSPDYTGLAAMMFGPDMLAGVMPMQQRRDQANWDNVALGSFHEKNLPDQFVVPDAVKRGIDKAYDDSIKSGYYERGGNIVKNYGSGYSTRQGGDTYDDKKDEGTWAPNSKDVGVGQKLVGDYHSHAYRDGREGTFSEQDMAGMVDMDGRISMIRSGSKTFMLTKTREFDAMVKKTDDNDPEAANNKLNAMKKEMMTYYNAAVAKSKARSDAEKWEEAARATAAKYHLGYYQGTGTKLDRAGVK